MAKDVLALRGRELDVVHSHFSHDHTLARLGRPKGATLIRSIHAPRSLRWATPAADGYTVPMESLARELLPQRVLVLPALVGPEFAPPANRRHDDAVKRIGMVSSFQPSRRHELGIAAFLLLHAAHPATHLTLIGDGELEAALRRQAAPGGAAIEFAGYQAGPAFVRALQGLDEVWILGLGNDWSARAAAQARACGVRVVSVDEGALSRYADALTEPTPEAIVEASRTTQTRPLTLEKPDAVAQRVLAFYRRG
jgi:glycosyltransferase involved in cell wall biosynthesis